MKRVMLGGKIHRAVVTGAVIDYEGSIEIDADLINAVGMLPFEKVQVYDINNGNRFETYIIEGERGSAVVSVNGAAARLVSIGDLLIIVNFIVVEQQEAENINPEVIILDKNNKPVDFYI